MILFERSSYLEQGYNALALGNSEAFLDIPGVLWPCRFTVPKKPAGGRR
jgi:hypothetical protein